MKYFTLLSISLIAASPIFAEDAELTEKSSEWEASSISLFVENDFRFSDRYYTNGLKLTYTDKGDDWWTSAIQFALMRAVGNFETAQAWQTASVGQDMYVGYDITDPNPPENDHPYCGWLYLSSGAHLAKKNSLDSLTVSLGVVGPQSWAGDVQRAYHDLIDDDEPMGWHTQVKNEPGIIIAYNHAHRLYKYDVSSSFSTDLIGSLGADLGNVKTQAKVKLLWRFGFNLPNSFAEKRIDSASNTDVYFYDEKNVSDWHLYLYAGGTARFVGYDIALDGNTFADSRSVAKKWLVGEGNLGISARYQALEINLNWAIKTEDFNTQREGPHFFWCANVKYSF